MLPQAYYFIASAGKNGKIEPSGSFASVAGATQKFTITPNPDYIVEDVKVDGVSVGSILSYTFENINQTHTISVTFKLKDNRNAFQKFQAEDYNSWSTGLKTDTYCQTHVGGINGGEWIKFTSLDFGNSNGGDFIINATAGYDRPGSKLELRIDSESGNLIGTVDISNTGGWCNYKDFKSALTAVSGVHDLYLVFVGGADIYDLNWIELKNTTDIESNSADFKIYPSPTTGKIYFKNIENCAEIALFGLDGKIICKKMVINNMADFSEYNLKGLYFLQINDNNKSLILRVMFQN